MPWVVAQPPPKKKARIGGTSDEIYDVIYSYTSGQLTIRPTIQFTHVPRDPNIGLLNSASTYGVALATKFAFNTYWSLTGRAEYIDTTGGTNVAYGQNATSHSQGLVLVETGVLF